LSRGYRSPLMTAAKWTKLPTEVCTVVSNDDKSSKRRVRNLVLRIVFNYWRVLEWCRVISLGIVFLKINKKLHQYVKVCVLLRSCSSLRSGFSDTPSDQCAKHPAWPRHTEADGGRLALLHSLPGRAHRTWVRSLSDLELAQTGSSRYQDPIES
jgi:hypothetical protein